MYPNDKRFVSVRKGKVKTIPMCKNCGLCCIGYSYGSVYPCDKLDKHGCTEKEMLCKDYVCHSMIGFMYWIGEATYAYNYRNRRDTNRFKIKKLLKEVLIRKGKDLTLEECVGIKKLLKEKGVKL